MTRKLGIVSAVSAVAALLLVASSWGGSSHSRLPLHSKVQKGSVKQLRVGYGEIKLFGWNMWAVDRSGPSSRIPVCVSVDLEGPLAHLPNGETMGPEVGDHKCGPIKAKQGAIASVPTQGGSITFPSGETESWNSFDVGIAAYRPNVDHVRLVFSDGASEVKRARSVPKHLAFKGAEPFHYVVFAVEGCIRRFEGMMREKVVASFTEPKAECENG